MMSTWSRILLGVAVVLGLSILALLLLGSRSWEEPAAHQVDAGLFTLAEPVRKLAAIDNGDEIAARPLFSATRRPPVAEATAETAAPAEPIEGAQVHGLFGREGAWGVIVSLKGQVSRLHPGEQLGPWTLRRIDGQDVEFMNEAGERAVLQMRPLPVAAPPVAPPAEKNRAEAGRPAQAGQTPPAEAAEQASSPESQTE